MEAEREIVALAVAAFLKREADRRRCNVNDLAPMVGDAFDLALECLRLGDERAHERPTLVDGVQPVSGVFSFDDEITERYPAGHPLAQPRRKSP